MPPNPPVKSGIDGILKAFSKSFVNERYQERFVHEALKKPDKLLGRICHQMNHHGGGGYLVVNSTGSKFYAQAEGFPPPETYAGSLQTTISSQSRKKHK